VYPDFLRVVQQLASYSSSSGGSTCTTQKPTIARNNDDRMEIGLLQVYNALKRVTATIALEWILIDFPLFFFKHGNER
jgi:hypothetical protein